MKTLFVAVTWFLNRTDIVVLNLCIIIAFSIRQNALKQLKNLRCCQWSKGDGQLNIRCVFPLDIWHHLRTYKLRTFGALNKGKEWSPFQCLTPSDPCFVNRWQRILKATRTQAMRSSMNVCWQSWQSSPSAVFEFWQSIFWDDFLPIATIIFGTRTIYLASVWGAFCALWHDCGGLPA